ncbi:MAG: hypothetical protein ACREFX_10800 [Opitutaceae bacterium]
MYPACPHLPPYRPELDWRSLHRHREGERRGAFYLACLEYGQVLWRRERPARAILCLDRAMGADLLGDEPELVAWPKPYAALAWILRETPAGVFLGNPRVHFQHYAGRMNDPRRDQRRWRAWACWALARAALPNLGGDPGHAVREPVLAEIAEGLRRHGLGGEDALWFKALAGAGPSRARP